MSKTRPTSLDVAELAGVSRTTVSFVLNDIPAVSIPETTRQRVRDAARQLNYHPNAIARKLASGKSWMIGLVQLQSTEQAFNDGFLLQVFAGLERVTNANRFHVLLTHIDHSSGEEYTSLFAERHVDGIVLSGPLQHDPELEELYAQGYPIMLLGQMADHHIPFVDVNAELGAEMATGSLIDDGHRRIGLITNAGLEYSSAQHRRGGYLKALDKAGLPLDQGLIRLGDFTPASGYQAMIELLNVKPRPTAVFVASDVVAIGALQAIKQAGLRVPEEISIIGFDDIPFAQYLDPPLSTVRLPAFGLGWAAGERLIRMILGEGLDQKGILLNAELVLRATTGKTAPGEVDKN